MCTIIPSVVVYVFETDTIMLGGACAVLPHLTGLSLHTRANTWQVNCSLLYHSNATQQAIKGTIHGKHNEIDNTVTNRNFRSLGTVINKLVVR